MDESKRIARLEARVAELEAELAEAEYWDLSQITAYLGYSSNDAGGVRRWCSRHRIARVTLAKASEVRAARQSEPGRSGRRFRQ